MGFMAQNAISVNVPCELEENACSAAVGSSTSITPIYFPLIAGVEFNSVLTHYLHAGYVHS